LVNSQALDFSGMSPQVLPKTTVLKILFLSDLLKKYTGDTKFIPSVKRHFGLKPNKYDEIVDDVGKCSTSFVALQQSEKVIRSGFTPLCVICSVQLTPLIITAIYARKSISDDFPKPFGEGRNGFARTECLATIFVSSSEFSTAHNLPVLGKILSVVGHEFDVTEAESFQLHQDNFKTTHQSMAMQETLKRAGLKPSDISFLELHGPSTVAGDIDEYNATTKVYCQKPRSHPLYIGVSTSTVGNTELAYGLVAILKALMVVSHGLIPGCMASQFPYQFDKACDLSALPSVIVPTKTQAVTFPTTKRGAVYAAVHGFGLDNYAGHLILEVDDDIRKKWQNFVELSCSDQTYILDPPLAELKSMSPLSLATVKGFSVTFLNRNRIEWLDGVDLRSVGDLSRVLIVTDKSVELFPNGLAKPKIGKGLNRPAQITLYNIFCPTKLTEDEFEESLRKKLQKQGAVLCWYKKAESSCCFRVEHF
jgi:hypothetical protein